MRMLLKAGGDRARAHDVSALRFMSSVGEPLNPEASTWCGEVFARPFHDNRWQAKTGGIMIANIASTDAMLGSMGRPLPGIEAGIVAELAVAAAHAQTAPLDPVEELARP